MNKRDDKIGKGWERKGQNDVRSWRHYLLREGDGVLRVETEGRGEGRYG